MARTLPEITSPVSRGQIASIGIAQNFGTSQGPAATGGFVNNSLGGSVDRGTQSFSNAAVSPSAFVQNPLTGASKTVSTSSVNPQSIQDDSSADVNGERVVSTTAATNVAASSTGADTIMPKSMATELPVISPGAVRVQSATIAAPTTISYEGVATSLVTGSVSDNIINQKLEPTAASESINPRIDGKSFKGPQGLPSSSVQVRDTADFGPNNLMPFQNGTADKP